MTDVHEKPFLVSKCLIAELSRIASENRVTFSSQDTMKMRRRLTFWKAKLSCCLRVPDVTEAVFSTLHLPHLCEQPGNCQSLAKRQR